MSAKQIKLPATLDECIIKTIVTPHTFSSGLVESDLFALKEREKEEESESESVVWNM